MRTALIRGKDMKKILGMSIFSLAFVCSSLVLAQTCPNPAVTQPQPLYSDWAISSYEGNVTSSGKAQYCVGGTGWKASVINSSGVFHDAFVSAEHVEKYTNVISPDIMARPTSCEIDKVTSSTSQCLCTYPCGLLQCCSACYAYDGVGLGSVQKAIKPKDDGTYNLDDVAYSNTVPKTDGRMSDTLLNILLARGTDDYNPTKGQALIFNGRGSCLSADGVIENTDTSVCLVLESGKQRCFQHIISVLGRNQGGDSGSRVETNNSANQGIGILVGGTGTSSAPEGTYYVVKIAQIEQDLGTNFRSSEIVKLAMGGVAPTNAFTQLDPEEDARTQQLRVDQEKVDSSISRNFRHRKSGGVFDHWFFGSRYLKHVIDVSSKAIFSSGDQPPIQRFQGIGIGVYVDKGRYLDEVGREVPSKVDGITVEVVPPVTNATDLMQGEGH
jgi:hypothetical protein